ncbi:MAG: hypothetical protein IPN19_06860 [Elusimicrobia bacterium]|nr:hypothetical protein [Elusimicrobiota bacterium]
MTRRSPWTTRLKENEAAEVLKRLVKRSPRLAKAAEREARRLVKAISPAKVAVEVERALRSFDDIDNLNARAGATRHGYVEPTQAACDLYEERMRPFPQEVESRWKWGDVSGAAAVCQGIVLGCYRVRNLSGGVIEWAGGEDMLSETAGYALETFFKKAGRRKFIFHVLTDEFFSSVADWAAWIGKLSGKGF